MSHFSNNLIDLMDPNLPAWNYAVTGLTGSGKSVLSDAIYQKILEEVFHRKLAEENRLFDHFVATGELIDSNDFPELN